MPIEVAPFVLILIVIAIALFYSVPNLIYSALFDVSFKNINVGIGIVNSVIWWSIISVSVFLLYKYLKRCNKLPALKKVAQKTLSIISYIFMFIFVASIIIGIGLIITWIILLILGNISNGGERIAFTVIIGFVVGGLSMIFGAMAMSASESMYVGRIEKHV